MAYTHASWQERLDAKRERIEELTEDHYEYLTETVEGFTELMEEIYEQNLGSFESKLFSVYRDWSKQSQKASPPWLSIQDLCGVIDHEASILARNWAEDQEEKEFDEGERARWASESA